MRKALVFMPPVGGLRGIDRSVAPGSTFTNAARRTPTGEKEDPLPEVAPEAPKPPTAKEAAAIKAALFLSVRMSPTLATAIRGKFQATIPPIADDGEHVVAAGDRLFLREWTGAPTGRADVVRVVGVTPEGLHIERAWGWHQGKIDDDLAELGLVKIADRFPKVGF